MYNTLTLIHRHEEEGGGLNTFMYLSSSKARLWLVFTLFSLFLLAVQCVQYVQFKKFEGKLAWSLESCI